MAPPHGVQIRIRGTVQGVGFRPTVWRLAQQHGINGTVCNDGQGVEIEAWGDEDSLNRFARQLEEQAPPLSRIAEIERVPLADREEIPTTFQIVESAGGETNTTLPADAATCPACLAELFDPNSRRYRYPFTNCTHCGPRFSIIDAMPYDRATTSMAGFAMCPSCEAEYRDPADRRFHAQATCCPKCGPRLWLESSHGKVEGEVIEQAVRLIGEGKILAIKGIGGFHLACDATNSGSVERLRARKRRPHKPFALMARDIEMVRRYAEAGEVEAAQLQTTASPIVLLQQKKNSLPTALAPNLNTLGFMLPYTPLHHLLMSGLQRPLVMTSANRSGEPLVADNDELRETMADIADHFLLHDRAIINRLDDSVLRVVDTRPRMMRRARGYAPAPIRLARGLANDKHILAMGAEMKGSFCLVKNGEAIVSQYLGDLKDAATYHHFRESIERYGQLFDFTPQLIAIDSHPNYLSSQWGREIAKESGTPLVEVQHHHAHIAAVMAEHALPDDGKKVLGVVLDGLGYGADGTPWGGEFLLADYHGYERLASFEAVAMPGGNRAVTEPWRNTFAQLDHFIGWDTVVATYGDLESIRYLAGKPLATLKGMTANGINSPRASSAGRLFDAVAVALGICREGISYDGQAAVELEALAAPHIASCGEGYKYSTERGVIGWRKMWRGLLQDIKAGEDRGLIAARFHKCVARAITVLAEKLCAEHKLDTVVLGGGTFQNGLLLGLVERLLPQRELSVRVPEGLPGNDGGVAMGQALVAARRLAEGDTGKH